ncbi:MAG: M15 family metallopeptidase, partial [Bacillota bacterium]|nr:M15 family metallopeptidase [Bacillota bacterium]
MSNTSKITMAIVIIIGFAYSLAVNYNLTPDTLQKPLDNNQNTEERITALTAENHRFRELNMLKQEELKRLTGLALIEGLDSSIVIDLRYATSNNFTGRQQYAAAIALLRYETALKLARANSELLELGYRIKVWDAYRPLHVQEVLWELVQDHRFVAHPDNGSRHNRGAAVDVTLVDAQGVEVLMPTEFDDFTEKASRSYPQMDPEARINMDILTEVMVRNGFTII